MGYLLERRAMGAFSLFDSERVRPLSFNCIEDLLGLIYGGERGIECVFLA